MAKFRSFQYYNFSGGLDFKSSPPLVAQDEKKCSWSDGFNVELLKGGGIVKMKGSQLYAVLPESLSDEIIGGFEGENEGNSFLVVVTKNGKFLYYNNEEFIVKKADLTPETKPNFKKFLNGVFVSNGIDDPFLFIPGSSQEIYQANATTAGNHQIRGQAVEIYKGRIFIGDGAALYYSALGKFNDWTSANDAGVINNFHNDTSPITALCCYKDTLIIHKAQQTFVLTGNSPGNFTIEPFSNLGSVSPFATNASHGIQVFFNNGIYPFTVNELGQIIQESALSGIIKNKLQDFVNYANREAMLLNYYDKSQLWCFLYRSNKKYFDTILIYDYVNKAWFQRIAPYEIVAAWEYEGQILCSLRDGRIVKEAVGSSFLGEPVTFSWSSPFFHFGNININKTIENLYLILAMDEDNNFNCQVKKNYSDYEIEDNSAFSHLESNTLVFYDDHGQKGQGVLDDDDVAYGYVTMTTDKVIDFSSVISGSNKSVQLQFFGDKLYHSLALLGVEFCDVFFDER
ncbi:MAG: hypothetical protein PHX18_00145 [Candidatus Gastranaerophilales bacterium]|nr:hypothetical protein [Candidatus Gastranaerophilales bacterium]